VLQRLECYNNSLTTLNVSGLTNLWYLYCYNNSLTALNVSGLTSLRQLYCYNNSLTALNVSGRTALTSLDCSNNRLTNGTLNITGCTLLAALVCNYNDMTPDPSSVTGYPAITPGTFIYSLQNASGFRPVTGITGIPGNIAAGTSFDLSAVAQVLPADATKRTIVWSISGAGAGAAVSGGHTLTTTGTGSFYLRATITDGTASGTDYMYNFPINAVTPVAPVGSFDIAPIPDQTFTNSQVCPALTVKYGGATLLAGAHYVVTYANNISIGTATATVIGIGGYSGTRSVTFEIVADDAPPATAFGGALKPSGGTGIIQSDPYIAVATAPVNTQTLHPSDITMADDDETEVTIYANADFTHSLSGVDLYPGETATVYVKITSLGTDYYYVLKIDIQEMTPPQPIKRLVQLPLVPGVKTYPPAGSHYVPNGGTFTFTLTPPSPGDVPSITTGDANEDITATPNADGSYTVVVAHIYHAISLYIAFNPTASEIIASAQVRAAGHTLYIYATTAGTARIYSVAGQLVKSFPYAAGETTQTTLSQGVYIVATNERTHKIVIQ
jgi:hypothetical protein